MLKLFIISILTFLPDSMIAYGVMVVLGEEGFISFLIIFLLLQIFYLIRLIFQASVGRVFYILVKESMIKKIFTSLKENQFPSPAIYGFSPSFPEGYYREILKRKDTSHEVQMTAQEYNTRLETLRDAWLLLWLLRIIHIHAKAIQRYQEDFNTMPTIIIPTDIPIPTPQNNQKQ